MLFLLLKEERSLMYLHCVIIVILYCPLIKVVLYRDFQLGLGKSVLC